MDRTERGPLAKVTAPMAFVGLVLSSFAAGPVPVSAADNLKFSFCTDATEVCTTVKVINDSSVVVTSVKVTQKSNREAGCAKLSKRSKENMPGGGGFDTGKFTFKADASCEYRIKYSTTRGCIGDKKANLKPPQIDAGKSVYLSRGCGGLTAYIAK